MNIIILCFTLSGISFAMENSTIPLQYRFAMLIQDWVNQRIIGTYYLIFTKFLSVARHSNGLISNEVELQFSNCTKEKFSLVLVRRSNGCHELFLNNPSYTLLCTVLHYGFALPLERLNVPEMQCYKADSTIAYEIEEQTRMHFSQSS
ncbi:hypothetical protein T07_11241 [Trichinella nelsoni]|uniref:Uncharacterized protein n=1 Tax=Trichinella nelsoni TaxID=6336 RepID=A0A0V0SFS1_9BILA|nr:hypothetical protein T07_11241 [Trichinella nelsoni]